MQRVKMSAGITAKIGRFNSNAAAKLMLGQEKSTIDFDDIINSGRILICNFSKGLLGEDVSELFGIAVLAKLQLASLRRARIAQSERKPFYLYVDEFQNFATASFVQMLSESRKYKLFMTMAEQSTSQQKDQQMVSIILANVGTVICFRTGNPHDEQLLLPLFSPYIDPGEIANLSAYTFFARLSSVIAQEPLSGRTLLITDPEDNTIAASAISYSRKNYGRKQKDPEQKLSTPKHDAKEQLPKAKVVVVPPGG
jgi:DNA helicase HerA-like ATPase